MSGVKAADAVAHLRVGGCVFAEKEAGLLLDTYAEGPALEAAVGRRTAGEPLEQVLGYASFARLRIAVQPRVFIPRRRAEALAVAAVDDMRRASAATFLDLGCGAGAIAATVASRVATADVWASDVSETAVRCARVNADRFGFSVVLSDWWADLPGELAHHLEVVAAYLPHVPDKRLREIPADYRRSEEECAVRGGRDGLDALRAVLPDLGTWLAPSGVFLTMLAGEQLSTAAALVTGHGWVLGHRQLDDDVILRLRPAGQRGDR